MGHGGKRAGAGRKPKVGRPSTYSPEFARQAIKLCDLGATDDDLAEFFGVNVRTILRWKVEHPEFCQALNEGKAGADDRVERSLFQRAVGYSHDAVKIMQHQGEVVRAEYREHYAPDTTAAIFWLKNRRPEQWRDKQVVEHDGKVQVGADAAFGDLVRALEAAASAKSGGSGG